MPSMETATLTADELREYHEDLSDLAAERKDLQEKHDKAHVIYKDAKESLESKEKEILRYASSINESHPLFEEQPENIPWPFPLDNKELAAATLANVAADPLVLGVSIGLIKAVKEKCSAATLGELEKYVGPTNGVDSTVKAKKSLARILGPNQALKLLRGIDSFVRPRKARASSEKKRGKKEKASESHNNEQPIMTLQDDEPKAGENLEKAFGKTQLKVFVRANGFDEQQVKELKALNVRTIGELQLLINETTIDVLARRWKMTTDFVEKVGNTLQAVLEDERGKAGE